MSPAAADDDPEHILHTSSGATTIAGDSTIIAVTAAVFSMQIVDKRPGRVEKSRSTHRWAGRCQDKRGDIPLEAQVGGKKTVGGRIEREWTTLKSSNPRSGTGVEAPEESCREI